MYIDRLQSDVMQKRADRGLGAPDRRASELSLHTEFSMSSYSYTCRSTVVGLDCLLARPRRFIAPVSDRCVRVRHSLQEPESAPSTLSYRAAQPSSPPSAKPTARVGRSHELGACDDDRRPARYADAAALSPAVARALAAALRRDTTRLRRGTRRGRRGRRVGLCRPDD